MMRRRFRLLAAALCLTAAKLAFGFAPIALVLAPPVVTTVGGLALSTWAAIAAGVGALIYSIGLSDGNGNQFMNIRVNPNAPQTVPAGWTPSSTPGGDPTPPGSASSQVLWRSVNTEEFNAIGFQPSFPALASAFAAWWSANKASTDCGGPCTCNVMFGTGGTGNVIKVADSSGCISFRCPATGATSTASCGYAATTQTVCPTG